jgi:hypothetical protein
MRDIIELADNVIAGAVRTEASAPFRNPRV